MKKAVLPCSCTWKISFNKNAKLQMTCSRFHQPCSKNGYKYSLMLIYGSGNNSQKTQACQSKDVVLNDLSLTFDLPEIAVKTRMQIKSTRLEGSKRSEGLNCVLSDVRRDSQIMSGIWTL